MSDLRLRLRDANPEIRLQAAKSLAVMGAEASEAVPDLIPLLDVRDDAEDYMEVRHAAFEALNKIGPAAQTASPKIMEIARLKGWGLEDRFIFPLPGPVGFMKAHPDAFRQILLESFETRAKEIQESDRASDWKFHRTLEIAEKVGLQHFPDLMTSARTYLMLEISDDQKRADIIHLSCDAIKGFGPEAKEAIPEIVHSIKTTNPRFEQARSYLIGTLGSIGQPAIPALRDLAAHNDTSVNSPATSMLKAVEEQTQRSRK